MLPASVNLTYEARCVQVFKIIGFAATRDKPGCAASRACTAGGHDWRIEFHPTASNPNVYGGGGDWIMFRVRLTSKGSADGVAASFSCRLVDPSSPAVTPSSEKTATSSMFYQNYSRDVFLIRRGDVDGSPSRRRRSKDGFVFVECALTVVLDPKDVMVGTAAASLRVPSSDLHRQFGELLRIQKGADVTFLVGGEAVAAHRSVLAARSPVFMAELFGGMREAEASPRVEVGDMEAKVFRALLHFIYTDTAPELEKKGEQATLMAQHLLKAADRYGLERLKRICAEKVSTDISADTVAITLALAEQHGCSKLKSRCMEFILATPDNLHAVAETEGFEHLEASCPSVLTELLKLMSMGNK